MANDNSIGALWKKGEFLSGMVEVDGKKVDIVVFPNKYKEGVASRPDYRILKSRPKNQQTPPDEVSDVEPF